MSNAILRRDRTAGAGEQSALQHAMAILELLADEAPVRRLENALIDRANGLSPHVLAEIYQMLSENASDDGRARIAVLAPMWNVLLAKGGAEYRREVLFHGATLFRSAVQGERRSSLICFTGFLNTMFMSNCRFLDMLGKHPIDVVFLSTPTGTFGKWNLGGAGSFVASLQLLTEVLAERGIVARCYIGSSAGGGAALHAAMLDGQVSCIMLGGRFYRPGKRIPLAEAGPAFEPFCDCWHGPLPPIYNIYGAEEPYDAFCDARLRAALPHAKSYPIPADSKHNPMAVMGARGKLRVVMDLIARVAAGKIVSFDVVTAK